MALYHSARGSVDYTVVGTPTIVNGVASGFSNSNYINVQNFSFTEPQLIIRTKYRHITTDTSAHYLYFYSTSKGTYNGCLIRNNGYFAFSNSIQNSTAVVSQTTVSAVVGETYDIEVRTDINTYFKAFINGNLVLELTYSGISNNSTINDFLIGNTNPVGMPLNTGSIDLNHTYITVNGQPWFGICPIEVKKHQIMGPVGYTVVGSPTITDGVLSGCNSSNYVKTSSNNLTSSNGEIQFVLTTQSTGTSSWAPVFTGNTSSSDYSHRIEFYPGIPNGGRFRIYWDGAGSTINFTDLLLATNTTYKVYFSWSPTQITFSLQDLTNNGSVVTKTYALATEQPSVTFVQPQFLRGANSGDSKLDLNNTYIKVNGKLWFYQPQATKYIQRNNQLVWADPKLYLSAPDTVELTTVGSPTITNGVASGFSSSDYVKTEDNLPSNITSLQIHTEVIKADYPSSPYGIFMVNGYPSIEFQGQIFRIYVLNQDGTNTVYTYQGTSVNLNEKVIVDMYWENGITRFVATQGGVTKLDVSYSDTKIASSYITFGRYWNPLNGSIDLNNTYIKVNDVMWFQYPKPTTYTVVGSPTIVDNIASTFSLTDYLLVGSAFKPYNLPWEIQFCFKLSYPGSRKNIALINSTLADYVFPKIAVQTESSTTLGVQALLSSNGTSGNINASAVIISYDYSKKGYVNLKYVPTTSTTGNYIVSFKQEGGSFAQIVTYSDKPVFFQSPNDTGFSIGADIGTPANWRSFFIGDIYLNESYIKINNQLWFYGKNHATQNIAPVPADYPLTVKGPVNYTIVGNPTITNGVASGFSSSNYLKTDTTFSQDVYNAWIQNSETVVKFRTNALQAQHIIYIPTGGTYAGFYMRGSQGKINWQIYSTSYRISPDFVFSVNTDYWLKGTISNGVATFSYSTDGTNYTTLGTLDLQGITDPGSYTSYVQLGYGSAELGAVNGSIDLNHTYIKVNGNPLFGKAYPVPSIGYVDMRTQVFTAAPEGAVVGRDE